MLISNLIEDSPGLNLLKYLLIFVFHLRWWVPKKSSVVFHLYSLPTKALSGAVFKAHRDATRFEDVSKTGSD